MIARTTGTLADRRAMIRPATPSGPWLYSGKFARGRTAGNFTIEITVNLVRQ